MFYDIKKSGERIRQLRKQHGYTQEQLSQVLDIDRRYYGRVEIGKRGCSIDLLIQLSEFFDVSIDYLILGKYHRVASEETERSQQKEDLTKIISSLEEFKENL